MKGRTAIITGSGRNIGKAIALKLAKNGVNVVINGSTNKKDCNAVAEEAQSFGAQAIVAMGDIGLRETSTALVNTAIKNFGSVDILVNNAAIRPSSPFLQMTHDDWSRVLAVNLEGSFCLAQACIPSMQKKNWGRIINFAGMNAIHGYKGRAHVSVSKHGCWGLTKALAKEFGPDGITTNIISPGPIETFHDDEEMTHHINSMKKRIPLGRLGKPDEIAAAVLLLASDEGAFINGEMIKVNGGTET